MTLIDHLQHVESNKPYILHIEDVYSSFHWAFALANKNVESVLPNLHKLFCQFGIPSILSNNCQFTQDLIVK